MPEDIQREDGVGVLQKEHVLGCVDVRQSMSPRNRDQTLCFVIFNRVDIVFAIQPFNVRYWSSDPPPAAQGKEQTIFAHGRASGRCKSGLWPEAAHLRSAPTCRWVLQEEQLIDLIRPLPSQSGG